MHVKYLWAGAALVMLGAATAFLALDYVDRHPNSTMTRRGVGWLFVRPDSGRRNPLPFEQPELVSEPEITQGPAGIGNPAEETTEPEKVEAVPLKIDRPLDIDDDDFDPNLRQSRPEQTEPEHIPVMPREITPRGAGEGEEECEPRYRSLFDLFWEAVSPADDSEQLVDPPYRRSRTGTGGGAPSDSSADQSRMDVLMIQPEQTDQMQRAWRWFWQQDQPSHLTPDRVDGGIAPRTPGMYGGE